MALFETPQPRQAKKPLVLVYKNELNKENYVYFDVVTSISQIGESEVSQFPVENGAVITDHIINKNDVITFSGGISNDPLQDANISGAVQDFTIPGTVKPVDLNYPEFIDTRFNSARAPKLQYPKQSVSAARVINSLNVQSAINAVTDALSGAREPQPTYGSPNLPQPPRLASSAWVTDGDESSRAQKMFTLLNLIRTSRFMCEVITQEEIYTDMVITKVDVNKTAGSSDNALIFNLVLQEIQIPTLARVGAIQPDGNATSTQNISARSSPGGAKSPQPNDPAKASAQESKNEKAHTARAEIVTEEQ